MARLSVRLIRSTQFQLGLLFILFLVAGFVWAVRTPTLTIAIGERDVDEILKDVSASLGSAYGELCGETAISEHVGEFVETGLTSSSDIPTKVTELVEDKGRSIGEFQQRQLDSDRIVLVFRAEGDLTPSGDSIVAEVVELKPHRAVGTDGTVAEQAEWIETESSILYPCG